MNFDDALLEFERSLDFEEDYLHDLRLAQEDYLDALKADPAGFSETLSNKLATYTSDRPEFFEAVFNGDAEKVCDMIQDWSEITLNYTPEELEE